MRVQLAGLVVAVGVVLVGCGSAPLAAPTSHPFPEEAVCGTEDGFWSDPVRVLDSECELGHPGVRWWIADPDELDYDDYTPLHAKVDDDYTGKPDGRTHTPRFTKTPTTSATPSKATGKSSASERATKAETSRKTSKPRPTS